MMFSPNSMEKNPSTPPENCSPGRSNFGSNRFTVGIAPLSDENQHRIQLAVHKYNSSGSNTCIRPVHDRRNSVSPFKFTLLRNSPKSKSIEDDPEEALKHLKKTTNKYQGVGNFPTVQLNKTPVLCRPIKRHSSNEFKVQLPELPVNRFLNHLPDDCSNMKSTTRSVLDVLQDLSRKRIHSKDDTDDINKRKSKGLGGDVPLDIEAPYKPLFVQKSKNTSVAMRDNTTQTLDAHMSNDSGSSLNNVTIPKSAANDPRAELRRKLARQNNEIYASLSSSINSPFPIKRKLDKMLISKENGLDYESSITKKPKLFIKDTTKSSKKSDTSLLLKGDDASGRAPNSENFSKSDKVKSSDLSPKTSPNKDRLMTIFLNMQNNNSKLKVYENEDSNSKSESHCSKTNIVPDSMSQSKDSENAKLFVSTSTEVKTSQTTNEIKTNGTSAPPMFNFGSNLTSVVEKEKISEPNKTLNSVTTGDSISNISTPLTFGLNVAKPITATSLTESNVSNDKTVLGATLLNQGKMKNTSEKISFKPFGSIENSIPFGGENKNETKKDSPIASFKGASSLQIINTDKSKNEEVSISTTKDAGSPISNVGTSTTSLFGVNTTTSNTTHSKILQSSEFDQSSPNATRNSTIVTPTFTFGSTSATPSGTSLTGQITTTQSQFTFSPNTTSASVSPENNQLTASPAPSTPVFSFGQKPTDFSSTNFNTPVAFGQNNFSQSNAFVQANSNQTAILEQNSINKLNSPNKNMLKQDTEKFNAGEQLPQPTFGQSSLGSQLFAFGQNTTAPDVSKSQTVTTQPGSFGQNSSGLFSFVQKPAVPEASPAATTQTTTLGQAQTNLFSFGQKPPEVSSSTPQVSTGSSIVFGQNSLQQNNTLGQSPAQTLTAGPSASFGQTPSLTSTSSLNQNSNQTSFGQITSTTSTFGQTSNTLSFGAAPTPQNLGFGQTSAPNFGSAFGAKSPVFGQTTQSSSAPAFSQTSQPSTAPTFGQATQSTSVPAFGQTTHSSTAPTFGQTTQSSSTPAFGQTTQSSPAPAFGLPSTTQAPTFQVPAFGQGPNKPQATFPAASGSIFGQAVSNKTSMFGQGSSFGATVAFGQNNTQENTSFGAKPTTQVAPFSQTPGSQAPLFGQNSSVSALGPNNNFSFGSASPSATNFTATPAPTTTASLFAFGSQNSTPIPSAAFSFGGTSTSTGSGQSQFSFGNQNKEAFKFGATPSKEVAPFGGSTTPFSFSVNNNNNNSNNNNNTSTTTTSNNKNSNGATALAAQTPAATSSSFFSFGSNSAPINSPSPASGFNFSANPSTPVFSFGGSGSASSTSNFSFGSTPQPSSGPFGQSPTPQPFSSPGSGVFSIGSGSGSGTSSRHNQARTARSRRRP